MEDGRYTYLNPYKGGANRRSRISPQRGFVPAPRPIAITNCLNFGNPYDPEVYYQFKQAVTGMGDACRVFDTP
jgi:phosphoribosylformylglycinamidine synthase